MRLASRLGSLTVLAVLFGLVGCTLEPEYRTEVLRFEPGLVGEWETDGGERATQPPIRMLFEARSLRESDGRVRTKMVSQTKGNATTYRENSYRVTLNSGSGSEVLGVFALGIGNENILAFQKTGVSERVGDHPLHQVIKYHLDGDQLQFWWPTARVVWIPAAQALDAPTPGPVPTIEELEARMPDGMFVVFDIDRLVEVLQAHAADARLWDTKSQIARRIVPRPAPNRSSGMGSH